MSASIRPYPLQAFGLAMLAEVALLFIAAAVITRAVSVKPMLPEPVPIAILNEDPPPPEQPPEPKPLSPKPVPVQPQVKATPPLPVQQQPLPVVPVPVTEAPTAFTEPVPELQPPPLPTESGKIDPSIEYAAKVRAAVQAAVYYPPAAAALHFSGRVRVEFHLRDSLPSDARVLIASGIGLIDRAALQSVQNAHFPAPPAAMSGTAGVYQVWVEFNR